MTIMSKRLELHEELCGVLGSRRCYFSPPSTKMEYDCILYSRDREKVIRANDKRYKVDNSWTIIYITLDQDSEIPEKILKHFVYISKDREYVSDGLYHVVFTLYY